MQNYITWNNGSRLYDGLLCFSEMLRDTTASMCWNGSHVVSQRREKEFNLTLNDPAISLSSHYQWDIQTSATVYCKKVGLCIVSHRDRCIPWTNHVLHSLNCVLHLGIPICSLVFQRYLHLGIPVWSLVFQRYFYANVVRYYSTKS